MIKITLQREARTIFQTMAKEAGVGVNDLAEIACYNLIALYVKDHGTEITPDVLAAEPNSSSELNHLITQRS